MNEINYVSADDAAEIMGNRRVDASLQKELKNYLADQLVAGAFALDGDVVPSVRAEYLARPTVGDLDYASRSNELGLRPWTVTYAKDEFTTSNAKKSNMACPRIALPKGQIVKQKITTAKQAPEIGSIVTNYGVTLQKYWQSLCDVVAARNQATDSNVFDISNWYLEQALENGWRTGSKAAYYYPRLMCLYAARAVLFCDFDAFPDFTPARLGFWATKEALGVEPLVIKWKPRDEYPAIGDDKYRVPEFAVDLSDITDLTCGNIDSWIGERIGRNEQA